MNKEIVAVSCQQCVLVFYFKECENLQKAAKNSAFKFKKYCFFSLANTAKYFAFILHVYSKFKDILHLNVKKRNKERYQEKITLNLLVSNKKKLKMA